MAANQGWQRPESGSREGKLSNGRARAARAMQEFFFENLGNPARVSRVGVMRQFSTAQFNSTVLNGRFWRLNELDR